MTEIERILESMSGSELDIYAGQGGKLPPRLLARLQEWRRDATRRERERVKRAEAVRALYRPPTDEGTVPAPKAGVKVGVICKDLGKSFDSVNEASRWLSKRNGRSQWTCREKIQEALKRHKPAMGHLWEKAA